MSSSSDAADGATALLWSRRVPGTPAVALAAALTGTGIEVLSDAVSISVASSPEVGRLLRGMDARIRTLNSTVALNNERCVYSVRGPVQWAETMTARANSLGSEDVFVCATAERSFDTIENRVLVAALEVVSRASRALDGPLGPRVTEEQADRIAERAGRASQWLQHPRLRGVPATRLTGRDAVRLRSGHRTSRMGAVLAVRDRALEPLDGAAVARLCDGPTSALHRFWCAVSDVLVRSGAGDGSLALAEGSVHSGQLLFRHPATVADEQGGLFYRGVPLLPPTALRGRLPWSDRLPDRGVEIGSAADVERLVQRMASRERERVRPVRDRAPAQGRRDQRMDAAPAEGAEGVVEPAQASGSSVEGSSSTPSSSSS